MDLKTILVALDGSEQSEKAFVQALAAAQNNGSKLILVSVLDDKILAYDTYAYDQTTQLVKPKLEQYLEEKAQLAKEKGIKTLSLVRVGEPKRLLGKKMPKDYDVDLIVIGNTGKGVIGKMLLGSTAQYVINHAPCNVMVVKK